MNTVSGRDTDVLPTLKSQLHRLLLHGARNRRDRLLSFLHGLFAAAFLVTGVIVAIAIRKTGPWEKLALLLVVLCLINTIIQTVRCRTYLARMHRLRRIVSHGFPVTAHVVQASPGLFRPGKEILPCLVLFTHQAEVAVEWGYLSDLTRRVYALKGTFPDDPDAVIVADMTRDGKAVQDRRRTLPLSMTDGSTVYCADLMVDPALLPGGCLTGGTLPCIAEASDRGGIELVPAWLLHQVAEESAPSDLRRF